MWFKMDEGRDYDVRCKMDDGRDYDVRCKMDDGRWMMSLFLTVFI